MLKNRILYSALTILLIPIIIVAGDVKKIELENLDGNWEGDGKFILPMTSVPVSIEGKANFVYDKEKDRLRTSLTGEKLFFTYSDSGYITIDSKTDSVRWEIWDNRNKHAIYHGLRKDNQVVGERARKKDIYKVIIEQTATDSIEFKLTVTPPDGEEYNKATFNLWRVK